MATMQACHALWYGFESRYLREYVKQMGCATTIISNRLDIALRRAVEAKKMRAMLVRIQPYSHAGLIC